MLGFLQLLRVPPLLYFAMIPREENFWYGHVAINGRTRELRKVEQLAGETFGRQRLFFAEYTGDKTGQSINHHRRRKCAVGKYIIPDTNLLIDFSGRPGLVMDVPFKSGMIGTFDSQLTHEFFQGFVNHAFVTLHIDNLKGENAHHQAETVFKAFARALRAALERDPRAAGMIPSTKGSL